MVPSANLWFFRKVADRRQSCRWIDGQNRAFHFDDLHERAWFAEQIQRVVGQFNPVATGKSACARHLKITALPAKPRGSDAPIVTGPLEGRRRIVSNLASLINLHAV